MYNFNYHRPLTVDEAVSLVAGSPDGKLMAITCAPLSAALHWLIEPVNC